MSWDQSYSVPTLDVLLERLAGISGTQLLIDHLEAKGLKIVDVEDFVLTEGMYGDVMGTKVRLSDGRVYLPKLVESLTANGNYGNDIYAWYLIEDEPEVIHTDASEHLATPEQVASAEADLATDESELASDGVLVGETDDTEDDELYGGSCGDGGCGCGF